MFLFIETGKISKPIYPAELAAAGTPNKQFLIEFMGNLLHNAFLNLQP